MCAVDRFLFGKISTVDADNGGLANNIFELFSFLGVANVIGRSVCLCVNLLCTH